MAQYIGGAHIFEIKVLPEAIKSESSNIRGLLLARYVDRADSKVIFESIGLGKNWQYNERTSFNFSVLQDLTLEKGYVGDGYTEKEANLILRAGLEEEFLKRLKLRAYLDVIRVMYQYNLSRSVSEQILRLGGNLSLGYEFSRNFQMDLAIYSNANYLYLNGPNRTIRINLAGTYYFAY